MKRIAFFALLLAALAGKAQNGEKLYETENYRNRMAEFARNPLTKGQVVFLGNSITQGAKWDQYFPGKNTANRGISGDNTEGMLNRIGEIAQSKPKTLFIMAGINDISQETNNKVIISHIRNIVYRIKYTSPNTVIYIQSVLPINNDFGRYKRLHKKEKQIENLNKDLEKYCKQRGDITFIDVYPALLSQKRKMNFLYTTDGLHLSDDGYAVWVEQIRQYVE